MNNMFNPQTIAMNLLKNNSNPILKQLLEMGNRNDTKGLEEFATNFFKQQGKDFKTEYQKMMNDPISFIQNYK